MEKRFLEGPYHGLVSDRIRPDPGDFPDVDLPVGDYVGSRRRQMSIHARTYSIGRLPDIDRNLIEIA
jgi:hypothetical protein